MKKQTDRLALWVHNYGLGSLFAAGLSLVACGTTPGTNTDAGKQDQGGADSGTTIEAKFSSLYADYLQECKSCHTPTAPGRTADTEKTLDFTSAATAFTTITTGSASGLIGNQKECNSVPFIQKGSPNKSLIVASFDADVRRLYDNTTTPKCNAAAISDMTLKAGSPTPAFLTAFKQWVTDGAANN